MKTRIKEVTTGHGKRFYPQTRFCFIWSGFIEGPFFGGQGVELWRETKKEAQKVIDAHKKNETISIRYHP